VQETIKQLLLDMQALSAEAETEEIAVLTLQLAARCYAARGHVRVLRAERAAATRIQQAFRGHAARAAAAGALVDSRYSGAIKAPSRRF
jgi:hypothetical protein